MYNKGPVDKSGKNGFIGREMVQNHEVRSDIGSLYMPYINGRFCKPASFPYSHPTSNSFPASSTGDIIAS